MRTKLQDFVLVAIFFCQNIYIFSVEPFFIYQIILYSTIDIS